MQKDTKQDYRNFIQREVQVCNLEAEKILASGLLAGSMSEITEIVTQCTEQDFYDLAFRKVYQLVSREVVEGRLECGGVDHVFSFKLANAETLRTLVWNPATGIVRYLDLANLWPLEKRRLQVFVDAVKQKTELRQIIKGCYEVLDICHHDENNNEAAFQKLQDIAFQQIARRSKDEDDCDKLKFSEIMMDVYWVGLDQERRAAETINTCWPKFQKATGGMNVCDLVIISAPSGKGKSAFSLNLGVNVGVIQKQPTLYINTEITTAQMARRVDSYLAYIDSRRLAQGEYCLEDGSPVKAVSDRIQWAADKYFKGNLEFEKVPDLQVATVENIVRKHKAKENTKLVIVDYIGRMDFERTNTNKDLQEWQVLKLAAMRLKRIAMEQRVCVVMVAQLTDGGSLQGSKAMKNEADLWINLNRLEDKDDIHDMFPFNTILEIRKARNSADNMCLKFRYDGMLMRFNDSPESIKAMIDTNKSWYGDYASQIMTDEEYKDLKRMCDYPELQRGRYEGKNFVAPL